MLVSRPGLGLETVQDHVLVVLVLVLTGLVLVLVLVLNLVVLVLVLVSDIVKPVSDLISIACQLSSRIDLGSLQYIYSTLKIVFGYLVKFYYIYAVLFTLRLCCIFIFIFT